MSEQLRASAERPTPGAARQHRSLVEVTKRVGPYAFRRKARLALALACGTGSTFFSLLEPWPIKLIFDHVLLDRPLQPTLDSLLGPGSRRREFIRSVSSSIER